MPRRNRNAKKQPRRNFGRNKNPFSITNMEQTLVNEPLAKEKPTPLDSLCSIHIHSIRKRAVDADGISAKAAIDSLVLAGLLSDDSTKYVKEVTYSQEKVEKGCEEETIITIWREEDGETWKIPPRKKT